MRRSGFTLVEMLLTLLVLAVGLSSLFALLPATANAARESREQRRMDHFAETVFSTLQSGHSDVFFPGITHSLVSGGDEIAWPGDTVSPDIVRPLFYTLSILDRTNQVREVRLRLRAPGLPEPRLYLHEFPASVQEWRQP